jgi:dTDP-4-amino-4,6-dideoxygalactose transaminase
MPVPLTDLTAQYRSINTEIDAAMSRTLSSGSFILGAEVESFEKEAAAYCGAALGVGVASGTDALHLALLACGIGEGDEVLTTPFTFIATAESIHKCGATPVFVDIDADTCNMDLDQMDRHLTPRTRGIVPVHLYGQPCDMTRVMQFASAHRLKVVEDCAQSLGATWQGKKAGSFGDAGCLSFFPSKVLGAYGDGGMVVTNDTAVADHVRILRSHGSRKKYFHDMPGFNSRLDSLQAAVLGVKLRHLDAWLERRREIAAAYANLLSGVDGISLLAERVGARHIYNYYTVRVAGGAQARDAVAAHLKSQGIATAVYYPKSLHLQPVYASLGYRQGDFPVSETAQDEVLSLPMYPELTDGQITEVVHALMSCPDLHSAG